MVSCRSKSNQFYKPQPHVAVPETQTAIPGIAFERFSSVAVQPSTAPSMLPSKSHRFETSHPRHPENKYSPSLFRRNVNPQHTGRRRPSFHAYNDSGFNHEQSHTRPPPRNSGHFPPAELSANMFTVGKSMYPHHVQAENQRRHSHTSHTTVARRHSQVDSDSDSGDSTPPRHSHLSRSKRHSTFPPSAYYSCQQKQVQPYHRRYNVHPAIPPTSPMIKSIPSSRHSGQHKQQQIISRGDISYEPPRYTYQPPQFEDPHQQNHERPGMGSRAETWSHHTPSSSRSSSSRPPTSRRGSVSAPPPTSRSGQNSNRHRDDDAETPAPANATWSKAKKIYHSKTASNTAEIAMFGLLALSKAL